MQIAVKEVGKPLRLVEVDGKYRTECVQPFTGENDRVEFVRIRQDGTFCMAVNENGLPLGLPTNFLFESSSPDYPIQKAVGTVVFVRSKYVDVFAGEFEDYEVEDLRKEDLVHIDMTLNNNYQQLLQSQFKDYGIGCFSITPLV